MNDESQPINETSQQSANSQKRKRNRNNKKNNRGGAQEESKEPNNNGQQNNNQQRRGGGNGGGQPQYQQKKGGNNKPQGAQAATMSAGPQNNWNPPSQHARNRQPSFQVNERPVEPATEEGFTGPREGWFDGKFT